MGAGAELTPAARSGGQMTVGNVKVFVLMAGLTALLGALGGLVGGSGRMVIALALAAVMNFVMYFGSRRRWCFACTARRWSPRARRRSCTRWSTGCGSASAFPCRPSRSPHAQPNAFGTGRNPEHAVVCVTEGLLHAVEREKLEGILAHELAHVRNRDTLLQTLAATLVGAVSILAHVGLLFGGSRDDEGDNPTAGLLMAIVAPIAAMLIQFAIGRQREFKADAVGAESSGHPLALASALNKLEGEAHRIPMQVSPAAAPLAIVNPLAAFGGVAKLFSTHPPTAERVARLQALAVQYRAV
jgi:heat shock protein HtpX